MISTSVHAATRKRNCGNCMANIVLFGSDFPYVRSPKALLDYESVFKPAGDLCQGILIEENFFYEEGRKSGGRRTSRAEVED